MRGMGVASEYRGSSVRSGRALYGYFCVVVIVVIVGLFSGIHHHSHRKQNVLPTVITLTAFTATTLLSKTEKSTYNLSLSFSNPNRNSAINIKDFTLGVAYQSQPKFGPKSITLGVDLKDNLLLPPNSLKHFSSTVSFSTKSFNAFGAQSGDVAVGLRNFLEDQSKGSVAVTVNIYFEMRFDSNGKWSSKFFLCDVVLSFKKSSTGGVGHAFGLPKDFDYMPIV